MRDIDINNIKQRFSIVGNNSLLNRAIEIAVQVAPTDMSVLIIGESGVGKEVFPKIVHFNSIRKHNPYIAVNCGAIPEGTIDSELFGHVKGAFTGAIGDRKGYFEEADSGTIFLDEVGELPLSTQARLLRVLETGEFIPVGASTPVKADVRIVAATNVNLRDAVATGKFREDLLFRLNTVPIEVPPLRERRNDIPFLFRYFASMASNKYSMPTIKLSEDAEQILVSYNWPGNIRELRNITERMSILESNRLIEKDTMISYLPNISGISSYLPQKVNTTQDTNSFSNEREILYTFLYDMKKDMNEMKSLIGNILSGKVKIPVDPVSITKYDTSSVSAPTIVTNLYHNDNFNGNKNTNSELVQNIASLNQASFEDALSYTDKTLSMEEVEKAVITASMKRNNGVRRAVAKELKIAERTLYRKLKEYGIE